MASSAVVHHRSNARGSSPTEQAHLLESEDDYFSLDNCYAAEQPTSPPPSHHHTIHVSEPNRSLPPVRRRSSAHDSDYENSEVIDAHLNQDSSDEESDFTMSLQKKLVVKQAIDVDYVNGNELDRELEVQTKDDSYLVVSSNSGEAKLLVKQAVDVDYVNGSELDRELEVQTNDDSCLVVSSNSGEAKLSVKQAVDVDYVNGSELDRELEVQTNDDSCLVVSSNSREAKLSVKQAVDVDYVNGSELDRELEVQTNDDSCLVVSGDLGEAKLLVKQAVDVDYVNGSELDRELEIKTTNEAYLVMGTVSSDMRDTNEAVYVNTEDQGEHDYMNEQELNEELHKQEPEYANTEDLLDAQLFTDDIKLRENSILSSDSLGVSVHPLRVVAEIRSDVTSCEPSTDDIMSQRIFLPKRGVSTLHRESEIKIETTEKPDDQLDPTVLNAPRADNELEMMSMNMLMAERVKSSVTPLTIRPNYRGGKPMNSEPDLSRLGTFERTLLQNTGATAQPMPNVLQIPWYHEGITRHVAESLLTNKSVLDGTYLLRDSMQGNDSLTLSVRCQQTVKHYRIMWDGKHFSFGLGKFPDIASLKQHFDNQPIISGDSGVLVQLSHPYPRAVAEPAIYHDPDPVFSTDELPNGSAASNGDRQPVAKRWVKKEKMRPSSNSAPELSVNSKEGFLTKLGYHVKNWKKRWFVLYRNELKYFTSQESKEALKVIDLHDALAVERDDSLGKKYCFKLVTSYRTFFMFGSSDSEANEWVEILSWKLAHRSRSNSRAVAAQ